MRILFQGDSITDASRSREKDFLMGNGYASLVTAELSFGHPGEYEFLNRGISGNRISDLLARMKCDMTNLKPDVMSILIGVNDVWHEINHENGVRTELYEELYNILVQEIKRELPDLRLIIMEPFVLKGSATEENWQRFYEGVQEKAAAAKRVAQKNGLEFIPLQEKFDMASKDMPTDVWLRDGVHPTLAGHELIAKEWIKAFAGKKGF